MRTATFLALPLLALATSNAELDIARLAFKGFQAEYGKEYGSKAEEEKRFSAFLETLKRLRSSDNPTHGVTKFADLTAAEFDAMYHSKRPSVQENFPKWDGTCYACKRFPGNDKLGNITSYDWTTKGVVTPIKDQGTCGSCWAFASSADMESTWYLAGNNLVNVSEQELVSCSKENNGCGGGWSWKAYNYAAKEGMVLYDTYPYTSKGGRTGTCDDSKLKPVAVKVSGFYCLSFVQGGRVPAGTEDMMASMLPKVGPFAIGIDDRSMHDYKGGIDHASGCGSSINAVNHIVTIVGFGEENGVKYWKIKNSWGKNWGEHGYYRIVRGVNRCAVATDAFKAKP